MLFYLFQQQHLSGQVVLVGCAFIVIQTGSNSFALIVPGIPFRLTIPALLKHE
jgi:hypothetical protein